jgi:TonB family protein
VAAVACGASPAHVEGPAVAATLLPKEAGANGGWAAAVPNDAGSTDTGVTDADIGIEETGPGRGDAPVGHGLSPEQVASVVRSHQGALRACYEVEAKKDPRLRGALVVSWTIDPSGAVTSAGVLRSTLNNARIEQCVPRLVRSWRFPASERSTDVPEFPIKFEK